MENTTTTYEKIGGDAVVGKLCDRFYEKFGHPRLRGRHMPFEIGIAERDQWVACMVLAMEDVGIEKTLSKKLLDNFFHTADFMRNKEG